jgi:heme/copper-type cytochrome/quinol oxidase subunit 2
VSATASRVPLVLGAVAIIIAAAAIGLALNLSAQTSDLSMQVGPKTQKFKIIMGEGAVISEVGKEDAVTGEYHRWEPGVMIVNKGDTVILEISNPRKHFHSFVLTAFGIDTGLIDPRTGTKTVQFVADKAGVFKFMCATPFNLALNHCDPDHATMVGYLVVLE